MGHLLGHLTLIAFALGAVGSGAAAVAALAGGAFFAGFGDVDGEGAALEFFAVEHFDGFRRFGGTGEFDERESAGFAGEFIHHEVDGGDVAGLREEILQVVFHGLEREITDK
jgi:hypothetical protein